MYILGDGLGVVNSCISLYYVISVYNWMMNLYVGLSVVYLSGLQSSVSQQFGTYSEDDVAALRAIAEDPGIVDLFLTYPCFVIS